MSAKILTAKIIIGLAALILAGCATMGPAVTVTSNANPDKGFESLKTFNFIQPLSTDRSNGARTQISTQLISSMRNELERRGLQQSDSPELLINFYVNTESGMQVRQVRTASSFHHYRRGRYNTWQNYQTIVTQYTQGTLAIDVIYVATNVLAWEGAADGRLRQNLNDFSQDQIDAIVAAVMAEFPTEPPQADAKE
jgi:hypothetical protein